jgi:hypothetical protein
MKKKLNRDIKASDFYDPQDPRGMSTSEYDDYMRAKNGIEFKSFDSSDPKHDLSKGIFNAMKVDANKQDQPESTGDIGIDYSIAQSKAIQKCMHLDAEIAYKSLSKQERLEEDKNGTIIQFLCGSHSYDGVWFGDKHPNREGFFWWRSILQEQDKKFYSEEDLEVAYFEGREGLYSFNDWLKQFKK